MSVYNILPVFTITLSAIGIYLINDVFDLDIDKVSHPGRALPQGRVTVRQALIVGISLMLAGPVVAFVIDPVAGLMVGMFTVTGILYSVPPIRLRKYPILPNTLIGVLIMFAFIAGATFRLPLSGKIVFGGLLLWAFFSFQSFLKDLEQAEGDAVGGVKTLPVLFGPERALRISAVVALSTAIFPIIFIVLFGLHWIFLVAIVILYILEGYSLHRYQVSISSGEVVNNEKGTLPLDHPWLIRVMLSFFGMHITLVVATLI
jgi:geranylgeranylglycerol-phosphate geranylgeranyltransferase